VGGRVSLSLNFFAIYRGEYMHVHTVVKYWVGGGGSLFLTTSFLVYIAGNICMIMGLCQKIYLGNKPKFFAMYSIAM
jgi:hypothetical protein